MLRLNKDVLFLIVEELVNDRKSLYSCLLVNRNWCEATIPILWKNPLKFCLTNNAKNILFNVILLHLSKESRDILENKGINLFVEKYQRPLFDYISFWRCLNLNVLVNLIGSIKNIEEPIINIIRIQILKLLINRNTRFTHLYARSYNQVHPIPGADRCFSELKFLQCSTHDNQDGLEGLARISKSVKTLEFLIIPSNNHTFNNSSGITKLIEAQKNLNDVKFTHTQDDAFHEAIEESLIKHANTIQNLRMSWKPITKFLSNLVNLISLDINLAYNHYINLNWSNLENISLPGLKILKARGVPSKSLENLIKNTKGHLTEISINYDYDYDNKIFIQTIYKNCPNLRYLGLYLNFSDNSISAELEKLLANCQYLNGLVITSYGILSDPGWDDLFKILIKSSPTGLFKFKFRFNWYLSPKLESLKSFFDGWKGRHPMLLQTIPTDHNSRMEKCYHLIEKYKTEGIIKKYDNDARGYNFDQFEWIQKKIYNY